jgi:hypothetical protein
MEVGHHRGVIGIELITIVSNSYGKLKNFKNLGFLLTNQTYIHEEIKCRFKVGNVCYYLVQTVLFSQIFSKYLKIKIYRTIILPVVLYGCKT